MMLPHKILLLRLTLALGSGLIILALL